MIDHTRIKTDFKKWKNFGYLKVYLTKTSLKNYLHLDLGVQSTASQMERSRHLWKKAPFFRRMFNEYIDFDQNWPHYLFNLRKRWDWHRITNKIFRQAWPTRLHARSSIYSEIYLLTLLWRPSRNFKSFGTNISK